MALYEVEGPDGVVYEVEGAVGATDSEIINALKTYLGNAPAATPVAAPAPVTAPEPDFDAEAEYERLYGAPDPKPENDYEKRYGKTSKDFAGVDSGDTNWFEDLAYGTGAGFVGTGEVIALGAATAYEEEEELEARRKIQAAFGALTPKKGDKDSIFYGIGNALGSAIGFGTAGTAVALAAPVVGVSAMTAGVVATAGLGISASIGEASERARAAGATEEQRNTAISSPMIILSGAAEAVPLSRVFKKINIPVFQDIVNKLGPKTTSGWGSKIYNGLLTGGMEAAQEASQTIAQNLTEQEYNALVGRYEGAVEGAGYGGAAGFILDMFIGRRKRRDQASFREETANPIDEFLVDQEDFDIIAEEEAKKAKEVLDGESTEDTDPKQGDLFDEDAPVVEETGRDAVIPENVKAGDKIEIFDVAGNPYTATVEAVSPSGGIRVLDQEGNSVLLNDDLSATTKNIRNPEYKLDSKGADVVAITGQSEATLDKLSDSQLLELKDVLDARMTNPEFGNLRGVVLQDLNAVKSRIKEKLNEDATPEATTKAPNNKKKVAKNTEGPEKLVYADEAPDVVETITDEQKAKIAADLTDIIDKSKKNPSPKIMAGRLEKSIAKENDTKKAVVDKEAVVTDTSSSEVATEVGSFLEIDKLFPPKGNTQTPADPADPQRTINPETNKFRFRDSNKLIGNHAELVDDAKALEDFAIVKIPQARKNTSESKREVLKQERAAQKYLSQFDTPLDAFMNAISEASDTQGVAYKPATKKTEGQDVDPLDKNLKGTGRPNAELLLAWAQDNLSVETNTQLTRALESETAKGVTRDKNATDYQQALLADKKKLEEREATKLAKEEKRKLEEKVAKEKTEAARKAAEEAQNNKAEPSSSAKMKAARASADENFDKILNNKKTDFTSTKGGILTAKANANRNKAEEYASASNNPDKNLAKLLDLIKIKEKEKKVVDAKANKARADTTAREANKKSSKETNADAEAVKLAEENLNKQKGKTSSKLSASQKIMDDAAKKHPSLVFADFAAAFQYLKQDFANDQLVKGVKKFFDTATTEQIKAQAEAYRKQEAMAKGFLKLQIDPETLVSLEMDVPDSVIKLIQGGDIQSALKELSRVSKNKRVKSVAKALADNMGTTKIEVAKIEGDVPKGTVATFDPKTNTITLSSDVPTTVHTLLHEATHAATISILSNKLNPHTVQLKKLYETVLPLLDSTYGATNLEEFVAEVFSNVKLQRRLSQITTSGESLSILQKIFRTITNFVRGLQGKDTKSIESALDATDAAIEAILAPSPEHLNLGVFYNLDPKEVKGMLEQVNSDKDLLNTPQKLKVWKNKTYAFLLNTNVAYYKNIFLGSLNTLMLGEIGRGAGFGSKGVTLHESILRGRWLVQQGKEEAATLLEEAYTLLNKNKALEPFLDDVALSTEHGSTIYQVNPRLTESEAKERYTKEKMRIWKAQRPSWNKLGKDGQEAYALIEDHYKKKNKELQATINNELESILLMGAVNDTGKGDAPMDLEKAKKVSTSLREQVYNRLFANANLEVYFPLVREGNYKLVYKVKKPEIEGGLDYVVLMFASNRERKLTQIELKKESNVINSSMETIDPGDRLTDSRIFKAAPETNFVGQTLNILQTNGVDKDIQESILKLFVDNLPQTSFARSLIGRKNIEGFLPSVLDGVRIKAGAIAQQIAKLQTKNTLNNIMMDIRNTEYDDSSLLSLKEFNRIKGEFQLRVNFAVKGADKPGREVIYRTLNQVAFLYTIGTNISSAIIQTAQLAMVVSPLLGARYGYDKTYNAIMDAKTLVIGSMGNASTEGVGISGQIDNYYDIDDTGKFTIKQEVIDKINKAYTGHPIKAKNVITELENLIPLVKVALETSALHKGFIADQLNIGEYASKISGQGSLPKRVGRGAKELAKDPIFGMPKAAANVLNATTAASAVPFVASDKFNRQSTLIAAYKLIIEDMVASKKAGKKYYSYREGRLIDVPATKAQMQRQAAVDANNFTDKSNGGTVLETGARWSQQGLLRTSLMYKNYGASMYYLQLKSSYEAITNSELNPEQRKIAFKEIVGMSLSAFLFAGVRGMPFIGVFLMIANSFLDDEEEDAETILRKRVGEFMYKGPITAITGIDASTRLKMNDLIIQENRFSQDDTAEEAIVRNLGGPAWSTALRFKRSYNDFAEGNYRRSVETVLPQGITNFLKVYRENYIDDGKRTRRGQEIIKDITWGEDFARVVGFPSTRYTLQQEQAMQENRITKELTSQRQKLNKKYYVASIMGDIDKLVEVVEDIEEFNLKHPAAGITFEAFLDSQDSHAAETMKMQGGITYNPMFEANRQARLNSYRNSINWGEAVVIE